MDQIIDWLNENEYRSFPLIEDFTRVTGGSAGGWELDNGVILDAQIVNNNSSFPTNSANFNVLLKTIEHVTEFGTRSLKFIFGDTGNTFVTFTVTSPLNKVYPLYLRDPSTGSLLVLGEATKKIPMVATDVDGVATLSIPVEPSVCYDFTEAWLGVKSIDSLDNKKTLTIVGNPTDSYKPFLPLQPADPSNPLQGDVYFLEGYNFKVDMSDGFVNLYVGAEYGLQMECGLSFIASEYLDCDELVSYINGIPPDNKGNFRLLGGNNINIIEGTALPFEINDPFEVETDARPHSLFVGLTFESSDLCSPISIVPTIE
jgi:hypothetical protein